MFWATIIRKRYIAIESGCRMHNAPENPSPSDTFMLTAKRGTRSHSLWLVPLILVLLLIPCAYYSIPLFHTLVELFAIGIAMMSFVVAWNTFSLSRNYALLYLGCGYFWVGILDLGHTLSFEDVILESALRPGTTIELWILARYLEACLLLIVPFSTKLRYSPLKPFIAFGALSLAAIAAIYFNLLPAMYIPGEGLTLAKVASEYLIILALFAAIWLFYLHRNEAGFDFAPMIVLSIIFTIVAELNFTLYTGLKETPIIIGHIFKLFSFWLIYHILVESSLRRPVNSLAQVVESYDHSSDDTVIIDHTGVITWANKRVRGQRGQQVIGQHCHAILHQSALQQNNCPICLAIENKQSLQNHEFENPETSSWHEVSLSGIHYSENFSAMIHNSRDITVRKRSELQFARVNRLYKVLIHTNHAISRLKTRGALLQEICDIAVKHGGFKMAWIGIIEDHYVRPDFYAGDEYGYLHEMQMRVDDSALARGPVGKAAKSGLVSCVNQVQYDEDFKPWRRAALQRGYAALASVPIKSDQGTFALFTLYSNQENAFDDDMKALLTSLSEDISTALFNLQQIALKREAEISVTKLSSAVEQSVNATLIANAHGVIEYINPSFSDMTGYSEQEVLGQGKDILKKIYHPKGFEYIWNNVIQGENWQGEITSYRKNGEPYWTLSSVSSVRNEAGKVTHIVGTSVDNTALKQAQQTIEHLAFYDPLTGLANRRLLMDRMAHAIAGADRHGELVAVLLCDLDNFKMINDSLGHESGDVLLKHIAQVCASHVRKDDTVARLGGDEFVILLDGIDHEDSVTDIANSIQETLLQPINLNNQQAAVTSSIGIAIHPQDGNHPDDLLRHADLAMYHAKHSGKNRFEFFQADMNAKARRRLSMENKLRKAIENKDFNLVYQPQIDIASKRIIGFEALIRWQNEDKQPISPAEFIPLAEETGMITAIGNWVIEQAFKDWSRFRDAGFGEASMSINVSAKQIHQPAPLLHTIAQALADHPNCPAKALKIEITESTLVKDIDNTINSLSSIADMGIGVAIDDFGTGYSSLSYLKRFPITQVKIDRSFVNDLNTDENDQAIVAAVIAMVKKLNIEVIAEGVETQEQSCYLANEGCALAQGFFFFRPLAAEQILALAKP